MGRVLLFGARTAGKVEIFPLLTMLEDVGVFPTSGLLFCGNSPHFGLYIGVPELWNLQFLGFRDLGFGTTLNPKP